MIRDETPVFQFQLRKSKILKEMLGLLGVLALGFWNIIGFGDGMAQFDIEEISIFNFVIAVLWILSMIFLFREGVRYLRILFSYPNTLTLYPTFMEAGRRKSRSCLPYDRIEEMQSDLASYKLSCRGVDTFINFLWIPSGDAFIFTRALDHLGDRVVSCILEKGVALGGKGWKADARGLELERVAIAWEDINAPLIFKNKLKLYRHDQNTPFLSLLLSSPNVWVLYRLCRSRTLRRPGAEAYGRLLGILDASDTSVWMFRHKLAIYEQALELSNRGHKHAYFYRDLTMTSTSTFLEFTGPKKIRVPSPETTVVLSIAERMMECRREKLANDGCVPWTDYAWYQGPHHHRRRITIHPDRLTMEETHHTKELVIDPRLSLEIEGDYCALFQKGRPEATWKIRTDTCDFYPGYCLVAYLIKASHTDAFQNT